MGGYGQKRMRMLVAIALVALILGAVSGVVFRKVMVVKNIVVEGVDDETVNTARALSGIRLGQSVFDIDERQIAINLREDGYIKLCSVEVQRPDTVILNLKKRVGVAAFEHLGFTYIVDSELSVLECVGALSDAGVMIVTGAPIQRTPVGMPLNVDATRGDMLKTLLSAVESAGISGDIGEINVANEQNLYCVMRGGLVFRLGDITNIESKLAWITPMQRQLLSEGRSSGTVDVTGVTSADYIPPSATPEATALPGQMLPTATFVPFDATPQPTQAA